jgi:hypothetical protein
MKIYVHIFIYRYKLYVQTYICTCVFENIFFPFFNFFNFLFFHFFISFRLLGRLIGWRVPVTRSGTERINWKNRNKLRRIRRRRVVGVVAGLLLLLKRWTYMYICIYVYMYICIYVYMYIYIYIYVIYMYKYVHRERFTHKYLCMYTYIYICMYMYVYKSSWGSRRTPAATEEVNMYVYIFA